MNSNALYQAWLEDFAQDAETIADLQNIKDDPGEIEDRFRSSLSFGTAGMRGVLGAGPNRMNQYTVRRATMGLADLILKTPGGPERGVAIAYDSRRKSDEFAKLAALTLCARGIRAHLFTELQPVPVLSFTLRHLGAQAGIVITASHNPPKYNGYKVYWEDGGQMPPDRADTVYSHMQGYGYRELPLMDEEEALGKGLLRYLGEDVLDEYMRRLNSLRIQPELLRQMGDRLSIVYTPLCGSGMKPVTRILSQIGMKRVKVVPEQRDPDPDFTTVGTPNPENIGVYKLAQGLAEKEGADLVFATDPDCDRLGCLVQDDSGQYMVLSGNQIGCLLLDYLLEGKRMQNMLPADGAVVKSIVSTQMANAIAAAYGVRMYEVLTGFKFIAEKIQHFEDTGSDTFLFGFEESYGYLSGTFVRDKDAVNASMLLAEAAAYHLSQGRTLYQALQGLYRRYGHFADVIFSLDITGQDGIRLMGEKMAALRADPPASIGGLRVLGLRDYQQGFIRDASGERPTGMPASDVLYYELEEGAWLCVRPSGTEPKVKLYVGVKADTAQLADQRAKALLEAGKALL